MKRMLMAACVIAALATPAGAQLTRDAAGSSKELIAVWIGAPGVDVEAGFLPMIREMLKSVRIEAAATRRTFVFRGVSLVPSVKEAVEHLAQIADFDEISAGGNWTNSAVARYLGPDIGRDRTSSVPQLIFLEREIRSNGSDRFSVLPEHELKRYIGLGEIGDWIKAGSPLPKP